MWWCNALSLWCAGALPVRITAQEGPHGVLAMDGLLVGGGDDIGAELYAGDLLLDIRVDPERDRLELAAIAAAIQRGLPILGVCRGAQMLNVFFGGTLHQEIATAFAGLRNRRTVLPRTTVEIAPDSRLAGLLGRTRIAVNSLHHQAVDRVAANFAVVGRDRHGIIQAIEDGSQPFLMGVQWHPEFLFYSGRQLRLFRALVASAEARSRENGRQTAGAVGDAAGDRGACFNRGGPT